jgi:D-galactarolactone cycloisomerase
MVDRTARRSGSVWDYDTARAVARGLEELDIYWLEEPFAQDDLVSPARLRGEVNIPITGGEDYFGLEPFDRCLASGTFDILQPDACYCGGILAATRIAARVRDMGSRCILHGSGNLRLAGALQASAAIGAEWQELGVIAPPQMPESMWAPALAFVDNNPFVFKDGDIMLPSGPGLGLEVNEDAIERWRVAT